MNIHQGSTRLVLSAYEPEQEFLNFDKLPVNIKSGFVGIGSVDAAMNATRYIMTLHPAELFFVGTAGAYPGRHLSPGDVLIATDIRCGDLSQATGSGYTPEKQSTQISLLKFCTLPHYPFRVRNGSVLTTPSITRATGSATDLRDFYKVDSENLELFAIARVASYFHLSLTAILGISNLVGPDSHAEWKANESLAVEHANHVLTDLIREGIKPTDQPKSRESGS